MSQYLLLATAKGLVVYQKSNQGWHYHQHHFLGYPVSMATQDPHSGYWWVCLDHKHWGPKIQYSADLGTTWQEVTAPKYPDGAEIESGVPATLRYIWTLVFGNEPGVLYVGTEPGGLFQSQDSGEHFQLVEALWNHPTRPQHWFGGGRNYAGIHSIVVDPNDSQHVYVGVSCAGVFETKDGGATWEVRNQGLKADFLPNPQAVAGHDPHMVFACSANPVVMWQQNHCGVYRSENSGQSWVDVTDSQERARYGFTLGIDHENPQRAWVVPATSDTQRIALDQSLFVLHTEDGGKNWQEQRQGLPQKHCFDIVLRHAFDVSGEELVMGTSAGSLFISADGGLSWEAINHHLPRIFSARFVTQN